MKHRLATLAFVGLAGFALSACGSAPAKTAEVSKEPAKPMLSAAAQQALAKAEADVKAAKARFTLWTTAESAFKSAQEAAKAGESETVLMQAGFVSDQVARGMAQLAYPTTELK